MITDANLHPLAIMSVIEEEVRSPAFLIFFSL